jgi:hypothetical protein
LRSISAEAKGKSNEHPPILHCSIAGRLGKSSSIAPFPETVIGF